MRPAARPPVIAPLSIPTFFCPRAYRLVHPQRVAAGREHGSPQSPNSNMNFTDLGLAEPLLRAVHEHGYDTPTPIQAQAIPVVLSGGDLLGGAQTGTGKTAGFTLPMLQRLMAKPAVRDARGRLPIRALILTPTRELAAQVEESVRIYGKYSSSRSMVMFGGVGMQPQIDKLQARRRHPGGHARPPARPSRPAHAGPEPRRDLRARRSRPHARHGLHPRHQEGAGHRAAEEAEPALLAPPSATRSRPWPTSC